MSLIELSDGKDLNFPRRLFEAFIDFALTHSNYPEKIKEIELLYLTNWQVIYIREMPKHLLLEFLAMLEEYKSIIVNRLEDKDVNSAESLLAELILDVKNYILLAGAGPVQN